MIDFATQGYVVFVAVMAALLLPLANAAQRRWDAGEADQSTARS